MSEVQIIPVTEDRFVLGESPIWSSVEQRLYFVDVRRPALHRLDPSIGKLETWIMPETVSAVAMRASGGVVLSMQSGLFAFNPGSGDLQVLVSVSEGHAENRLNDTRCDRTGCIWFGTMWDFGLRTTGALYRVAPDLSITRLRDGITIPNALCFSPNDRTLYSADTPTGRIQSADLDIGSGALGSWTDFGSADAVPGLPDGATVDAEGFLWNARVKGGCLARFAPDGRLDRIVRLPTMMPTSCAFGGPDLDTLYVTTATQGLDAAALAAQPLAGRILAYRPGVRGIPEPVFQG